MMACPEDSPELLAQTSLLTFLDLLGHLRNDKMTTIQLFSLEVHLERHGMNTENPGFKSRPDITSARVS